MIIRFVKDENPNRHYGTAFFMKVGTACLGYVSQHHADCFRFEYSPTIETGSDNTLEKAKAKLAHRFLSYHKTFESPVEIFDDGSYQKFKSASQAMETMQKVIDSELSFSHPL